MFVNLLDLYKAKTHKYTHKKRVFVNGKPSWKYYYKEHHGGGVTNVKDLKEGDAFKVNYKGQEGHFHVKKTEGNKVTVVLDETGKETTLSKSELRQVLLKTHATALKENVEKKKQTLAKRKSAKAKERAQQALDRAKSKIEGLEDEPKQEKQEQKETSIEKVLDIRLKRVIPQHSLKFNEQGLSTTAKDREIERFLAHIITDAVKDSIEDETSYTREEIDLASSTLGNPSMVLVARKLYIASVGNKTPDQIKEDLKLIYDRMKNDYTEYIKQRKQKKQERKQDQPPTDVESILREVNTEFEQKKDELEQKQAEREKKRQERKQAKEAKEAQQAEKKRARRERREKLIQQRKERERIKKEEEERKNAVDNEEITDLIEGLFPPSFKNNMAYRHEILIADTDDDSPWEEAEGQILGDVRNKDIMIRFDKNVVLSDYQTRLYGEKIGISKREFNQMLDEIKDTLKAKSVEEKRLGEIIIEF